MNVWFSIAAVVACGGGLYVSKCNDGTRFGFTGLAVYAVFLFAGGGLAWVCQAVKRWWL